jgi:hypothetical protein
MLSKIGNHAKKQGSTRLAAIRVTEIDDSLEVWIRNILTLVYSGSVIIPQPVKPQSFWCPPEVHALPGFTCIFAFISDYEIIVPKVPTPLSLSMVSSTKLERLEVCISVSLG